MQLYDIYSSEENEKLIMQLMATIYIGLKWEPPGAQRMATAIRVAEEIFMVVKKRSEEVNK